MSIIKGDIPTLFGGVSRQPPQVRQPNQVEELTNALASVTTGGFEKRPATQFVSTLSFLDITKEYQVHGIDRSSSEQDIILVDGSAPAIFAVNSITGAQKTVNIADTKRYFAVENTSLGTGTGVLEDSDGNDIETHVAFDSGETAFAWGWQLSDGSTGRFKVEGSADGVVWNDLETGIGGATSGTFNTTIDAVATGDHNYIRITVTTGMADAADTVTVWATFKDLTYILGANPEDIRMSSVADYTFILNRNVLAALAEADAGTISGTVQEFDDLTAASGTGNIYRVRGSDTDGFGTYYVQDNGTGDYIEIVDPTAHNSIDQSTMPHQLVRSSDGASYTYSGATWVDRPAGDETVNPAPGFIGRACNDVSFHRNRLVLLADEIEYLSQVGDVFSFFAGKATEILDSDPIERAATSNDVNILQHATNFRKLLFSTSPRAQFELTSSTDGKLTPETAELSQATEYTSSLIAKPASMGDVLLFGSKTEGSAVVYEYYFDQNSFNNTAADVTRHVRTYIPNDMLKLDADPTSTTAFVLTSGEQNSLFIYRTFFDGRKKLQSAWGKYIFAASEADALIHGFKIFSGFVVMVIERNDGNIYLEQFPIEREALVTDMPFMPLIDQRDLVTGVYNATHEVTRWVTPWEHADDAQVLLGAAGLIPARQLVVSYPDNYTLTLASVTAGQTLIIGGKTFTADATTTTAADREFSIAGTDSQDADELVICLNDATDGIGADYVASNDSGVVTVRPLDGVDNDAMTAPTGTAVSGGTITAALLNDMVAADGDHTDDEAYVGRDFTMTVELSKIYARQEGNIPITTASLRLIDVTVLFENTAYYKIQYTPLSRDAEAYTFEGKELGSSETLINSAPVISSGKKRHKIMTDAETVKIEFINDQPGPCVITAVQWRGQFTEIGIQG
jgi:hypothetical protein